MSQAQAYFTNEDGSIRPYTEAEIDAIEIETLGIRDGSSPTHSRRVDASTSQYQYLINPDYLDRFVAYMLGAVVQYLPNVGSYKLSRLLPQRVPDKPKFAFTELNSATGHQFYTDQPRGETVPITPGYTKLKCTVTAQMLPFDLYDDADITDESDRYVQTLPSQNEVSYLNLPGGIMRYKTVSGGAGKPNNVRIPYNIGFPVPTSTISRKWIRIPFESWGPGTILFNRVFGDVYEGELPFCGSVNKYEFLGYPPGYLLYLGVEEELQMDPLGEALAWNLTHKWQAAHLAPHNWKYFFSSVDSDASAQGWYFVAKDDASSYYPPGSVPDNTSLFNEKDHSLLFNVGAL
jgi:hypothetical protein